jgi:hypothetical protein
MYFILGLLIGANIALAQLGMKKETLPSATFVPEISHVRLLHDYLDIKKSPLVDESAFLMKQKNWRLLVAISAIESQFCLRQHGFNCWGIGGDSAYRHYSSLKAAIQDANDFIEIWHQKGKWATVHEMNGSYVVPYSQNWENVVNRTLQEMEIAIP